jgi:hypothetical protein
MSETKTQYYHPFEESSISICLEDGTKPINTTGCLVEDIDLYYQPLEKPWIATLFAFARILIVIIGEIVNIKAWKMIKKETGILSDVTKLFVCTHMVYLPYLVFFIISTDFIHPLYNVIGQWYCTCGWLVFVFGGMIISSHSFVVALMRYFFIIHKTRAKAFGKDKAKRLFLYLSILIPLTVAVTGAIEGSEINWMSFINKCYGTHHKVFLNELSGFKRKLFKLGPEETKDYYHIILAILWRVSKTVRGTVVLLMVFNTLEGFLYFKILSRLNR